MENQIQPEIQNQLPNEPFSQTTPVLTKKPYRWLVVVSLIVIFISIGVLGLIGSYYFRQNKENNITSNQLTSKLNTPSPTLDTNSDFKDELITTPTTPSTLTFSDSSSLPDKQKLGIWNASDIKVVYDRNNIPTDNSSFINLTRFDSAIRNLNITNEQQSQIEELAKNAILDLFVSYSDTESQSDFLTKQFYVKDVEVLFTSEEYSENYTLENANLELWIRYNFKYDWFEDIQDTIVIQTSSGQDVATNAQRLIVDWFSFENGNYVKTDSPMIVPNYNFPQLNSNQYPVFKRGFSNLISHDKAVSIMNQYIPNRDNDGSASIKILDEQLYPDLNFTNAGTVRKEVCQDGEINSSDVKYTAKRCFLNLDTEEVSCEDVNGSCLVIHLE